MSCPCSGLDGETAGTTPSALDNHRTVQDKREAVMGAGVAERAHWPPVLTWGSDAAYPQ